MARFIYKTLAAAMAVMLLMILAAIPVSAAETRTGRDITIESGRVIDDDLYIAGASITINGTINGDLIVAAGMVTINGTVNGSVIAACGTFDMNGMVSGSVRCAGGTISISGEIGRDLVVGSGELVMTRTAQVGRDILVGAGTARIAGTVQGDVTAASDLTSPPMVIPE